MAARCSRVEGGRRANSQRPWNPRRPSQGTAPRIELLNAMWQLYRLDGLALDTLRPSPLGPGLTGRVPRLPDRARRQ